MMGRSLAGLLLVLLAAGTPALAYVKFGLEVAGQNVVLKWPELPVRYFVSDAGVPGVSVAQMDEALRRAFATWQAVPTARVSFARAGLTAARPSDDDSLNVIGFESRPDLDRTLAVTSYTLDVVDGRIVEADILFNAAQPWSVQAGGEAGRFDFESIALHEAGHLIGLGHSAVGETELIAGGRRRLIASGAVMFPIAFPAGSIEGRVLRDDDIAGVTDLYPAPGISDRTGSISGTVTRNGGGVFGAHVVTYHLRTGRIVAGFTVTEAGEFAIGGLEPGPCLVRVEPLDDGDRESFFDGSRAVEIGFGVTYASRLAVVPRGGNAGGLQIAVRAQ
jgi:hypothetical protein